ncbi:hypothetical protein BSKO_04036 [Bryopsis sp. KO-2023]|nr:hypothetical protein BSKO_04036 [Bryopsis sp. KO-2023]
MAAASIRADCRCLASCASSPLRVPQFAQWPSQLGMSTREPKARPLGTETCKTQALLQPFEGRDGSSRGLPVEFLLGKTVQTEGPGDAGFWDVVGLGQGMVDLGAQVDESVLSEFGVEKGGRRVIGVEERAELVQRLDGEYTVRAGSSLANTLVAMTRLSCAENRLSSGRKLKTGMAGCLGADVQGEFFKAQLRRADVEFLSSPAPGTLTGSVVVLTTPDAQRSFVSFPGSSEYEVDDPLKSIISRTRMLLIEGYLLELPGSLPRIKQAVAMAKESGTVVVLTAGDAGLVGRHREAFKEIINLGTDILFTNQEEAAALLDESPDEVSAHDGALRLAGDCPMVVVTDGCKGSYLTGLGKLHVVPPCWTKNTPVDTCGAGDVYSAGVLYGFLRGLDLYGMGQTGARAASAIICKDGGRLSLQDAEDVLMDIRHNSGISGDFPIQKSTEIHLKQKA